MISFRIWFPELKQMETYRLDLVGVASLHHVIVFELCTAFNGRRYEIMRSSGLVDKKGVEIFEGDVVAVQKPDARVNLVKRVVFENGEFTFTNGPWPRLRSLALTVIGNIHMNPELNGVEIISTV